MIPETMKAVVLTGPVRGDEVSLTEYPVPKVRPGWVLVKVKAFGMNHSEQILRQGEIRADYIQKPIIPGIECVGEIADPSDSSFKKGQKVAALMGGMGRSFRCNESSGTGGSQNTGGYAELYGKRRDCLQYRNPGRNLQYQVF